MNEFIETIASNTKAAISVAVATVGSGVGLALSLIPPEIGKLATLIGIVASIYLIRRARAEAIKLELEIEIMRDDYHHAKERRASGPGDDLSPFGRVAESLETPPGNKPAPD